MESLISQKFLFDCLTSRTIETYYNFTHSHKPALESKWYWWSIFNNSGLSIFQDKDYLHFPNNTARRYSDTDAAFFLKSVNLAFMCTFSEELAVHYKEKTLDSTEHKLLVTNLMKCSGLERTLSNSAPQPFSALINNLNITDIMCHSWRHSSFSSILDKCTNPMRAKLGKLLAYFVSPFPLVYFRKKSLSNQTITNLQFSINQNDIPETIINCPIILMSQTEGSYNSWKIDYFTLTQDRCKPNPLSNTAGGGLYKNMLVFSPFPACPAGIYPIDTIQHSTRNMQFKFLSRNAISALRQMMINH
jgi:hypothetical protein